MSRLHRRAFLRNTALLSAAAGSSASAADTASGKYDFDTPYSRIGTDSVKWDRQIKLQDGREITVYSCSIQASYFDQQSGQWVNTPFFRGSALPILAHALLKAYDWILEARNEAKLVPF